jgi:hypothetical protein
MLAARLVSTVRHGPAGFWITSSIVSYLSSRDIGGACGFLPLSAGFPLQRIQPWRRVRQTDAPGKPAATTMEGSEYAREPGRVVGLLSFVSCQHIY